MRLRPKWLDDDLLDILKALSGILAFLVCCWLFGRAIHPSAQDTYDYKLRQLPPATRVLDEKSPEWWVVEVDGRKFLADFRRGATNCVLTPMTDREAAK